MDTDARFGWRAGDAAVTYIDAHETIAIAIALTIAFLAGLRAGRQ